MGIFPRFGSWINHNSQQPPETESEMNSNNDPAKEEKVYYDEDEMKKQDKLWRDSEKKHPWYDAPPKVKVTKKKGLCHMHIELTIGMSPEITYEIFANARNATLFDMNHRIQQLLESKKRKVLMEDGPRQIAKVEKAVTCNFLWWSKAIPITLIVDENKKHFTGKYKKDKMLFMKVFKGSYKVEPLYVDSKHLCKHGEPKNSEEYKRCSGGLGRIASKVIMDQYFHPYPPFDLPPLSWYIQGIIIKTTTTLLQMLQYKTIIFRKIP